MGADIHGFIECRVTYGTIDEEDSSWGAAIDLAFLYGGRNYDAFGCLFGVRNYAGFRPLAQERGLPPDVTDEVRGRYEDAPDLFHSPSWIGWEELVAVDWDEHALTLDARVHEYRYSVERGLCEVGKSFQNLDGRSEGDEWVQGGRIMRVERMTRREAVPEDGEWAPVWATMKALADAHGPEHVRLVVWFDN
ncbi:hypothetical protein M8Z33_24690 [Streptomyces sp. ZAF1911]|uniref:hypothetical protein n=1 Tax=unclassified Streptomyces TaxID=2593676 RepID=UPI00237B84E1|nr:hypothetical protein [Streptomyces sp. ZAF1911]MDD9379799.1 hypothetical protein [Streptomyces sp. ZAF1911]